MPSVSWFGKFVIKTVKNTSYQILSTNYWYCLPNLVHLVHTRFFFMKEVEYENYLKITYLSTIS